MIENFRNGGVDAFPQIGESVRPWALLSPNALNEGQHLPDSNLIRRPGQALAALRPPARFHKAGLLQASEDQFQKFLRDLLPPRDIGDFYRLAGRLQCKVENGLQGVFAFHGNVHSMRARCPTLDCNSAKPAKKTA